MLHRSAAVALLLAAFATSAPALAASWHVDAERSRFVVLTHRAGPAARLAHDHLIVARAPQVEIDFDPAQPAAAQVRFVEPVLALDVDPATERAQLALRLRELGLLSDALPVIENEERGKIRASMLGARQLFAERFPEIRAGLGGLVAAAAEASSGEVALRWSGTLTVEIRGTTVERTVPVAWRIEEGALVAELVAHFRFTDFGIEPYSTFLGAVRNADPFELVVELVARPEPETAAESAP